MRTILAVLLLAASNAAADHDWNGRDIVAGRVLYDAQCAACHGINLEGQPDWRTPGADGTLPAPPHDETGHTWHHDAALLFEYTQLGGQEALARRGVTGFNSGMPGFGAQLTEAEIWNILAYIRSTWPPEIQQVQARQDAPH